MKSTFVVFLSITVMGLMARAHPQAIKTEDCFFLSSLHYTAKGMAYWYDKANGGLETITGIPYSELSCQNCHVSSCDACHKTEKDGKLIYSSKAARNQDMCLKCHAREASILKIDRAANQQDVHLAKEMQCMDCHTAREIHGDGMEYASMKQKDAMDAKCEQCHQSVTQSVSHTVHGGTLDCKACHDRHVVSCTNCHFNTLIKEGKRVSLPISGWVFLMNHNGKVTSANMQTFVVEDNKTFLMFAPQHSHSVMKDGRKCDDCHATEIAKKAQKGKLPLTWLEKGEVKHQIGVVPVANGINYGMIYQDYQNGQWIPIKDAPKPVLHYAGFGEPLTKEQLIKLAKKVDEK